MQRTRWSFPVRVFRPYRGASDVACKLTPQSRRWCCEDVCATMLSKNWLRATSGLWTASLPASTSMDERDLWSPPFAPYGGISLQFGSLQTLQVCLASWHWARFNVPLPHRFCYHQTPLTSCLAMTFVLYWCTTSADENSLKYQQAC